MLMLIRSILAALAFLAATAPGFAQPNVVLILADDMSWVGTSALMDPERPDSRSDYHNTPSLERLAAEGMRFTDAYARIRTVPPRAWRSRPASHRPN